MVTARIITKIARVKMSKSNTNKFGLQNTRFINYPYNHNCISHVTIWQKPFISQISLMLKTLNSVIHMAATTKATSCTANKGLVNTMHNEHIKSYTNRLWRLALQSYLCASYRIH